MLWSKITSRKFLAALIGTIVGVAMAFGVDESVISTISGAVLSAVSLITYITVEGKVDAAGAGNKDDGNGDGTK